ncbi:MAG: response regulator, partial [Terracidiphilus sp.]
MCNRIHPFSIRSFPLIYRGDSLNATLHPRAILLISSDSTVLERVCAALGSPGKGLFNVESAQGLSDGLDRLLRKGIAAILLEMSLSEGKGIETFDRLFAAVPDVPILLIVHMASEAIAIEAVGRGAQDYLLSDRLDRYSVYRAIRNSIERKSIEDTLFVERDWAQVTLNSIGDAVLCTDIAGQVTYLNAVAEDITG